MRNEVGEREAEIERLRERLKGQVRVAAYLCCACTVRVCYACTVFLCCGVYVLRSLCVCVLRCMCYARSVYVCCAWCIAHACCATLALVCVLCCLSTQPCRVRTRLPDSPPSRLSHVWS